MGEFRVYRDGGLWRWRLRADNDRIQAESSQGNIKRFDSIQDAKRVRSEIGRARIADETTGDLLDKSAPWIRWFIASAVVALFVALGIWLVFELSVAQGRTFQSGLSEADQYLWFARMETEKAVIAALAIVLGFLGGNMTLKALNKPE